MRLYGFPPSREWRGAFCKNDGNPWLRGEWSFFAIPAKAGIHWASQWSTLGFFSWINRIFHAWVPFFRRIYVERSVGFVSHNVDLGCFMTGASLWIPAFAGMTGSVLREWRGAFCENDGNPWLRGEWSFFVIPAKAGIHWVSQWSTLGSFLESTESFMPGSIFQAHPP